MTIYIKKTKKICYRLIKVTDCFIEDEQKLI